MGRKTMRRIQGDFETEQLQRNTEEYVRISVPDWIADGVMLTDVSVSTIPTNISHTLQRQPLGFVITDQRSNGVVWRVSWDTTTLVLQATSLTTVNIWVF